MLCHAFRNLRNFQSAHEGIVGLRAIGAGRCRYIFVLRYSQDLERKNRAFSPALLK